MSAVEPEVRVTSQVHFNQLNQDGTVTPSVRITFYDPVTKVSFPVVIAEDDYSADNVRAQMLYKLNQVREVHSVTG